MENTDIAATTIHALFEFDGDYESKLDFTKIDNPKIVALCELKLLLLDEVSMIAYMSIYTPSVPNDDIAQGVN